MIEFIPADAYRHVYYTIMAAYIGTLAILVAGRNGAVLETPGVRNSVVRVWGSSCVVVLLLLLGLRPISYAFGDMGNYYKVFQAYAGGEGLRRGDMIFESVMWFFARYLGASLFFFTCLALYLIPLAIAFRRILGVYWPLAFFLTAAQFDFYGYGVNGIRQGVASSLLLLALSFSGARSWILVALAVGMHGSMLVPAAGYALTLFFRRASYYFVGWVLCLIVTLATTTPGEFILSAGFSGGRYDSYLDVDADFIGQFSKVGFRLDFLIYSLPPILIGFYLFVIRGVRDETYGRLMGIYLAANAVWLLLIRTPISNRVAYLSWFLMGLLIAYPLVKHRLFKQQGAVYGAFLVVMFGYTLFRNL